MKNLIILATLIFLLNTITEAKDYVLVGVSGFGTRKPENAWQPSGAHENLPQSGRIFSRHELVHYAKTAELKDILEVFECRNGKQGNEDLGLIIMVNSWGSSKALTLAKMYQKDCGQKIDAFYMIDGVSKPIGPFKKEVPAKICRNYYQTKGLVRGTDQKNCENFNLTPRCDISGYEKGVDCHIYVEWRGSEMAADHMIKNFLN
ncbi:MAG: hypothetical protein K9K67_14070 [Bacteriovoracaceae bacterium]|nr:hypothetical protein [Bacteriovoracaceae bacterium]